ncbi:hypothetical protein LEMLEM_LOCUS9225 [Lemmus lemmus]
MMDYEQLHNEARPRPRPRPRRRRNTLREVCWVTVAALLLAAAPSGCRRTAHDRPAPHDLLKSPKGIRSPGAGATDMAMSWKPNPDLLQK